jgi:hypothetical protein
VRSLLTRPKSGQELFHGVKSRRLQPSISDILDFHDRHVVLRQFTKPKYASGISGRASSGSGAPEATVWAAGRPERRAATGLSGVHGQPNKSQGAFFQGLLAEIEVQEDAAGALTRIEEALALAGETGEHWSDAFLHRLRDEILLKRDLANAAPADEAFLSAIAVAQAQKAPSFELRAAPDLARLHSSMGRSADVHALLASALGSFRRPRNFPEIEKAQTLLTALTS